MGTNERHVTEGLSCPARRDRMNPPRTSNHPHGYDGRGSTNICADVPGWNVFRGGCPGGEPPTQILRRGDRLLGVLLTLDGNIARFSHGQFGSVLAARWIVPAVVERHRFALDAESVSVLGPRRDHPQIPTILQSNVGVGT